MLRRVLVALTLVLAGVAVAGPALGDSGGEVRPVTTPEGFTSTEFNIHIYENGSARWTVQHSKPLLNQSQVDTFQDFARRFESTEGPMVRAFERNSRWTVSNVSEALGRPMTATNFVHQARIRDLGQTVGIVELSYTWTGFTREVENTLVVDDVFDSGMYIAEGQRLVFEAGENLVFVAVQPQPTSMTVQGNVTASDSVTWVGEQRFNDERPFVQLARPQRAAELRDQGGAGVTPAPGTDGGQTTTQAPGGDDGDGGSMMAMVALAVVLILGIVGGAAWYAGAIPRRGATAAGTEAEAAGGTATAAEPAVAEEDLLSDEDRVMKLLRENGGRMKQVDIVNETDWSKSKVSMLLSDMEDEDQISKLRVGRENIISLSGEEPDAAGSPFDEG